MVLSASAAFGQGDAAEVRAAAARRFVLVAVQQGITVPATGGQSFALEYDPVLEVMRVSEQLGPTSILSPQTMGEGAYAVRSGFVFFALRDQLTTLYADDETLQTFRRRGVKVDAHVGVTSLSVAYGLTAYADVNLYLPIVVVDAHTVGLRDRCTAITEGHDRDDPCLRQLEEEPSEQFSRGLHAGTGRVSVGTKYLIHEGDSFQLAGALDTFLPSPFDEQLVGPRSFALFPRITAEAAVSSWIGIQALVGADYDLTFPELRRAFWQVGALARGPRTTVDLGFSASVYQGEIEFNPTTDPDLGRAIEPNAVDSSYYDLLFGVKRAITAGSVISLALEVPVIGSGVRPDFFVTLALEYWPLH
jgi:hypothetical protein